MGSPTQEVSHGDEPSAVSTRTFDGRVPGPIRQRGQVRGGAGCRALAQGLCLPGLRLRPWHSAFVRAGRRYWQCARAATSAALISGTIFESTKLPLTRWFLAMHLLTQSKNNVSALELKRHLGVCYKTRLAHEAQAHGGHAPARGLARARRARGDRRRLPRRRALRAARRGRGSENKVPFIAAVQTTAEGHPQYACFCQAAVHHRGGGDLGRQVAGHLGQRWSPTGCGAFAASRSSAPTTNPSSPAAARPAPSCRSSRPSTRCWAT